MLLKGNPAGIGLAAAAETTETSAPREMHSIAAICTYDVYIPLGVRRPPRKGTKEIHEPEPNPRAQ